MDGQLLLYHRTITRGKDDVAVYIIIYLIVKTSNYAHSHITGRRNRENKLLFEANLHIVAVERMKNRTDASDDSIRDAETLR